MDSMKKRATVRAYSQQDISPELLDELLEIACRSSNTGNMQAYSIVVSRDPERKKALAACHFNQPQVVNAPVVLTFCADFNRFSKWCAQRNAQAGFNNVQALTYASIDAVIVAQTFCVAPRKKAWVFVIGHNHLSGQRNNRTPGTSAFGFSGHHRQCRLSS